MKIQIDICGGEYLMKIYDIFQEVFSCQVYAGDPISKKGCFIQWKKAACITWRLLVCVFTTACISMHRFIFIKDEKIVNSIGLDTFIGMAYVA